MLSISRRLQRISSPPEDAAVHRRFRRNVSISVAGSGLSLAAKLAQTAILTRALRIEDYGRVLLVLNFFVFLESFVGVRVSDLIFRFFPYFRERGEQKALAGLLWLSTMICLASAIAIYGGVLILSPLVTDHFYPNLSLTPLLTIYGFTILFSSFSGIYEPVLRLHNHFVDIVAPQVAGTMVTLFLLVAYLVTLGGRSYNLEIIIGAFAISAVIQSVVPLIKALRLLWPVRKQSTAREALRALKPYLREIKSCLVNSNLSGYLKLAISPGDVFLLGLFSTPTQLALFGLAKQLTAPLGFLQANIQTAVTPEIATLVATQRFDQLLRLTRRYLMQMLIIGGLMLVAIIPLGRFLILNFLPVGYRPALPIFYLIAIISWLMLAFLVFRPIALNLDLLRWHNLILLLSSGAVVTLILTGKLNAMNMALVQLSEVLILRSLFGLALVKRVREA